MTGIHNPMNRLVSRLGSSVLEEMNLLQLNKVKEKPFITGVIDVSRGHLIPQQDGNWQMTVYNFCHKTQYCKIN